MNKLQKYLLFFAAIFVLLISTTTVHAEDRYKWMWSTDKVGYFFDTETINFDTSSGKVDINIIDVWIKSIYTEEAAQEIIDRIEYEKIKYEMRNFHHTLTHYQINIRARQIRSLESYYYASEGRLIHGFPKNEPWGNIIPNTNAEGWLGHIIKYLVENKAAFDTIYKRSSDKLDYIKTSY